MSQLHILNGDSSKHCLETLKISGKVAVWREVLSDGPVHEIVGSDAFWAVRAPFFESTYRIPFLQYVQLTRREFDTIERFNEYDEIVLWFEYDLFCQINLMALCSYLHHHWQRQSRLSLVCVGTSEKSEKLLGLSEFPKNDLQQAYTNRVELTTEDLQFANGIWRLYCQPQPHQLAKTVQKPHPTFSYLKGAFRAHLQRFPFKKNGLNIIENKLLSVVDHNDKSAPQIVGELLHWQTWFGFADLQYFAYLKQLQPCFDSFHGIFSLNELGKMLLKGEVRFQDVYQLEYYLGGAIQQRFFAEDLVFE